jgi:3-hydroxyisobutyrate dehydrogenase-like beta-hydroxyacid dehydrogenase
MRVAFIGLDHVGQAMALSLLEAGHQLTVYDPTNEKAETLVPAGAAVANSIAGACCSADAVFSMLADEEAVEAAVLHAGGVVDSLPWNAIHIGSSTIGVECSDRLVEAHWDAGQRYIAAPVLGWSNAAGARLLMIAGGCNRAIAEVQRLFDAIGEVTVQLGGWPSEANVFQCSANALFEATFESTIGKLAPLNEPARLGMHD